MFNAIFSIIAGIMSGFVLVVSGLVLWCSIIFNQIVKLPMTYIALIDCPIIIISLICLIANIKETVQAIKRG